LTTSPLVSRILLVASIGPLLLLYAYLIYWFARNPEFLPIGAVEISVFATQIARALIILILPRFRRAKIDTVWIAFVPDLLIATGLAFSSFATGVPYLLSISRQIFGAWAPAFLIAFLPLATYKAASRMRAGKTALSETLPSLSFIFVVLAIFVSATYSSGPSSHGLAGVSNLIFGVVFPSQIASSTPLLVSVAGTVLALAMIVYGVSQGGEAPVMRHLLLALVVVGLAATVGWGLVVSTVTQSSTLAFAVPALALLAAIWGITHAS
jgi:hypothetical protein